LKCSISRRASRPKAALDDDGVMRRCLLVFISTTPGTLSLAVSPSHTGAPGIILWKYQ
jgi:hypothetical protein